MAADPWRATVLAHLGPFQERVALRPTFGATVEEGELTRTRVTYWVEAEDEVPAWLLTAPESPA